jgi:hypothetical protein
MKYKGEAIETQRIRMDRKQLVTEVKEIEEDPVFPLVTKKLPAGPAKQAPGTSGSAAAASSSSSSGQAGKQAAAAQAAQGAAGPASSSGSQAAAVSGAPAFRQLGTWQAQGKPVESLSVEVEVPSVLADQLRGASQGPEVGGVIARAFAWPYCSAARFLRGK